MKEFNSALLSDIFEIKVLANIFHPHTWRIYSTHSAGLFIMVIIILSHQKKTDGSLNQNIDE